jgi:hypothetical protein
MVQKLKEITIQNMDKLQHQWYSAVCPEETSLEPGIIQSDDGIVSDGQGARHGYVPKFV